MKTDKEETKRVGHTVMRMGTKKNVNMKSEPKKASKKAPREDNFEKKEFLRDE